MLEVPLAERVIEAICHLLHIVSAREQEIDAVRLPHREAGCACVSENESAFGTARAAITGRPRRNRSLGSVPARRRGSALGSESVG